MALLLTSMLFAPNFKPVEATETTLADQINACLGEVKDWKDFVNIGVVMHRSSLDDFDTCIARRANASDWLGVLAVKRWAEQAGYSSRIIDDNVKLALSNMPMFSHYSLPKTDNSGSGYFCPWDRCALYGYRYAKELDWETKRWDVISGFLALKSVRDMYGRAFYRCNPDTLRADSQRGTRWHESGSLLDCFLIFYELGVQDALKYAVQEWEWLNNVLWSGDHFNYAPEFKNWEYSGMDVFPNVAKLQLKIASLGNWSRVATDLQLRYISRLWDSPQWNATRQVVVHHNPWNPERRLDGTLNAWMMLNTFYGMFDAGNRTNMRNMLEGNWVTQAWEGLMMSDLRQANTNVFELATSRDPKYSNYSTALAALCLFLLGISPQYGRGLAIPLISDRHSCYGALNYRHFEFDYANHRIKVPVWGGTALKFMYGNKSVAMLFIATGIYSITFAPDWNSIIQFTEVSGLYPNECYLWSPSSKVALLRVIVATSSGQPIQGARVVITTGTTTILSGDTDPRGAVSTHVPLGTYDIKASYKGIEATRTVSVTGDVEVTLNTEVFIELFGQSLTFVGFVLWIMVILGLVAVPAFLLLRRGARGPRT